MAKLPSTTSIDLGRLSLSYGEGARLDLAVPIAPPRLGGQSYEPAADTVEARLDVSRLSRGYALRLRFEARLAGPCMRCLGPAAVEAVVDAREVDQAGTEDEELRSPYLRENRLEVGRWAQDAAVLATPARILCRPDCAGLCPVCGEPLNESDPHDHESAPDPRWAKLDELR